MKYRICRRYSLLAGGTWYAIQKRTLFGWHTLNISFINLFYANKYLDQIIFKNEIYETPLEWNKKKLRFYEKYHCKTNFIKVK